MIEIIYLIEITAYTGSAEEVFRFCTGTGYTTTPADTPANTFYTPRVEHPGLFRQDMFSPGRTSGNSSGGYGEIVLINTDGGLDSFVDYGFDGRRCVVKQGTADLALSEFSTVITGTVEQCEVSWNKVTMRLKDRTAELQTPFQTVFYAGDNVLPAGIEGTAELKDKPKPRLFGKCNNVAPVMVNTSKLIYQVDTGTAYITGVYDNGVALTLSVSANYTNQADMEANAPAAGEYRLWPAGGCFRLGSSPFGTITCDAYSGATAADRTAGQIIRSVVIEKLGAGQVVEQSIIALDAQAPYVVGFYAGTELVNTSDILDALCASVGAWWGFDNSGLFWSKQLTPPYSAQSLMTLTEAEIISLERTATADSDRGVPVYKVNVDFSKNWTVQSSGLAGSIADNQLTFDSGDGLQLSEDRRNLLGMEYLRTSATDATVQTKHLLAPEMTVQTTIDTLADADTEAARQLALRKVRRDRLNVKVKMGAIQYPSGGYWDDEAISELPQSLRFLSSAIDDLYLYCTGGVGSSGSYRLSLLYPTTGWAQISQLPANRSNHSSACYGGYLYVIGGLISSPTNSVIRLNTSKPSGSWDDAGVTDLPLSRENHTSIVYNGYLYVIGGDGGTSGASVIRLNLSSPSGAWDDAGVTDLPAVRTLHTSVEHNGYLYVIGGTISGAASSSVIRLNLSSPSGAWDDAGVTDLPAARTKHSSVVVDGYLYVIGGEMPSSSTDSVIRLNLASPYGAWESVASLPGIRSSASAESYSGNIFLLGGYSTYAESNTWMWRKNDNAKDVNALTSLGRTVNIKYPRYGYTLGRAMKIIGAESDHSTRMLNLELWG